MEKIVPFIYNNNDTLSNTNSQNDNAVETRVMSEYEKEQNVLFGQLINHIHMLQRNISTSQSIIVYVPHVESGLGNTVVGLVSSLISAVATDRSFQMTPFLHYQFFYDPIPQFYYQENSVPHHDIQEFFYYPTLAQGRALRRNHLNKLTKKKTLKINCFTDVTPHFLDNKHYQSTWEQLHLWKQSEPYLENVTRLLYEYVMYPKQPLCSTIVRHANKLLSRKMIGVQVRIGGKRQLYTDKQFLTLDEHSLFFTKIDSYMQEHHLELKDVYVFLSTDDPEIQKLFVGKYSDSVYVVNDFQIGHSSIMKNRMNSVKVKEYTQRAILDILLLQRADYLLYTNSSSFGYLASQLQQNRHSPVHLDDYIDWSLHEDRCSVFERSSRPFKCDIIGNIV